MKRLVLFLLVLLIASSPAQAAIYYRPTWDNLLKTLLRFGALDLTENKYLDEYAAVTDCDIYKTFNASDFRWNQVRDQMRQSINMNLHSFPANFMYQDKLALDRYDFDSQMYKFSSRNPLQKVNAFFLFRSDALTCGETKIKYMPRAFRAVLDESVSLPGLPLTQKTADDLLRRMNANHNTERLVYVRFNLHINYVGKVDKNIDVGATDPVLVQHGAKIDGPVILNSAIDTIDFYEDEHYKKLIYSFQP